VSTSSSTAAERDFKREFLKIVFVVFGVLLICFSIFFLNNHENNKYIMMIINIINPIIIRTFSELKIDLIELNSVFSFVFEKFMSLT